MLGRGGRVANPLDLAPWGRVYPPAMAMSGMLIGEVAAKSGVSRKALRLYERAGILPPARRTAAGYRVYTDDTLALLVFVTQARRLGFRLDEIKKIAVLKRSGQTPCTHVLRLVNIKLENIERALTDTCGMRAGTTVDRYGPGWAEPRVGRRSNRRAASEGPVSGLTIGAPVCRRLWFIDSKEWRDEHEI
jgi:MerR family copper efflux transcriptional regulator